MDQINIIDEKLQNRTQVSVVLVCAEEDIKTKVNRLIVNELFYGYKGPDEAMDYIIGDMAEVLSEVEHVAGCKTCTARVAPLLSLVKRAISEDMTGDYYTYCVMEDVFPAFRREAHTAPVASLNIRRYQARLRRFEMVSEAGPAEDSLAGLAKQLPGVGAKVKFPCECSYGISRNHTWGGDTVMTVVIHLNDDHQWPREDIADWLDSVDDPENGVDLAFKVPEKEEV